MSFVYLRRTIILMALLSVSACGGGGNNAAQAPTVEYAKTVGVGDGTLADYMNADWLYQNYLGEYGLPAEIKPIFIPELQMLANGFALQFKRGEDVQLSVKQFHQGVMMLNASGQMAQFFAQIKQDPSKFVGAATGQAGALRAPPAYTTVKQPSLSAAEQASVDLAKLRIAQEDAEWERVRKEYALPYELPGRVEKWFIYSPAMKGGKNSGGGGGTPPVKPPAPPKFNLSNWGWWHGDLIFLGGGNPFGHVAMVDLGAWSGEFSVIEAQTNSGVRKEYAVNAWASNYSYVEGYHSYISWYIDAQTIRNDAVAYARNKIGQSYNWMFWDKSSTSGTYCSQLIWQAYYTQGYDLDADGGSIVYPRDLTRSGFVWFFRST